MQILRYIRRCVMLSVFPVAVMSCERNPLPEVQTDDIGTEFCLGADVSWMTEMEEEGCTFSDIHGNRRNKLSLLKDYGIRAVRLRVWVNPKNHDNWCNAQDVLKKALRAKAMDMDVMIDFHYSDWWADPSSQTIPEAWEDHTFDEIGMDMAKHTYEVLNLLKNNGVEPKWVQVGNETNNGMLWPVGQADRHPEQYARLFLAGHYAVKKVFPEAQVIVHLDNGADADLYNWNLDILKRYGAQWDIIGMSVYPYWSMQSGKYASPDEVIEKCIANMRALSQKYDCDVMVVETGMRCADDQGRLASEEQLQESRRQLKKLIGLSKDNTNMRCRGVFYWEPGCRPSRYRFGAFTEEGRPTVIMDGFRE